MAVHTIATSSSLAGNQFSFSCSKGLKGKEGRYWEDIRKGGSNGEESRREYKRGEKRKDENERKVNEAAKDHQRLLIPCKAWPHEPGFLAQLWPSARDGIYQTQEPQCISLPLSSPTPESSNIQTTLEKTNPSAFCILLPWQKGLQSLLKASANCQGEITYCCIWRMNGPHSWCVIVI